MPIVQFIILLVQIFPSALKAIKTWQDFHGEKLDRSYRRRIVKDIKQAVAENPADLVKNLGKPQAPASTTQNLQNPS